MRQLKLFPAAPDAATTQKAINVWLETENQHAESAILLSSFSVMLFCRERRGDDLHQTRAMLREFDEQKLSTLVGVVNDWFSRTGSEFFWHGLYYPPKLRQSADRPYALFIHPVW